MPSSPADGTLTGLLRKRISRHIESCETCAERKRRELSPAMLFGVLPLFTLPRGLRQHVLRLVSDNSPDAVRYRDMVVRQAAGSARRAFRSSSAPASHRRRRRLHSHAAILAAAAALILLGGGGGTTAYLLSHQHHVRHEASATVTLTVTATPSVTVAPVARSSAAPAASSAAATSAAPTSGSARSQSAPAPSPTISPIPSPGTLSVTPLYVRLTQSPLGGPYTGTFTITAEGGPVSYAISVSYPRSHT